MTRETHLRLKQISVSLSELANAQRDIRNDMIALKQERARILRDEKEADEHTG